MKTPTAVLPNRMSHIDAIRAVAVLFVMWMHYAEVFSRISSSGEWLHQIPYYFNFGRIGVVVFFALSGLLIPKSLYGPLGPGTRRFVVRRFFRLYPAFWVSIPLGYLSYRWLFDKPTEIGMWLANATMLPDALGHPEMMGHYWTLETELIFYVLCLLLFWQGGLQRMRDLCLVCVGLAAAFVVTSALKMIPASALGQYKGMLYHLSIMFWGACFRQYYDSPDARVVFKLPGGRGPVLDWSYKTAFIAVTGVIASISVLTFFVAIIQHDTEHIINSISYEIGLAVFALLATVWKIHLRFFAWIGEISYSLYLLHGVPVYVIYWACMKYGWVGGPLGLYIVIGAVAAIVMSWLSFRFVEAPCIKLGHALTSSRRPAAPAAASAVYMGEPAPEKNVRR